MEVKTSGCNSELVYKPGKNLLLSFLEKKKKQWPVLIYGEGKLHKRMLKLFFILARTVSHLLILFHFILSRFYKRSKMTDVCANILMRTVRNKLGSWW